MRKQRHLLYAIAAIFLASLWGCGSSLDSGGDQTGPGTGISDAARQGSESCEVCHTAIVNQGWQNSSHDTVTEGCEGCHGGGQFHKGIGPIPYPAPGLDRCDNCHDVTTRHINGDDPGTATTIEGYVKVSQCTLCHYSRNLNPATTQWQHNPDADLNRQWAQSAHGGHIATGPVTEETAPAWVHYDWDSSSRASCQRCHTATGVSNFLTSPANYNSANNDFSHLSGWTATNKTSGQNEVLYCWGCHSNVATGALRNPGAITETYTAATTGAPATTVTYPDASKSNVCMGCHLGREVGDNIKNDTDADGVRSFINSHYLAAGGMVFGEAGYEFAGQDYTGWETGQTYGRHGNVARAEFGTDGPCVTCHMSSAEPHKFEVVQKDAAGIITAVSSTACNSCHGNMNAAWLEERKETFHTALETLKTALDAKGIYFYPAHPYFYTAPYVVGGTNTAFTNWTGVYGLASWKDTMGAAFNYNLLEHDPGAYAHNRHYALKLIADSIDFLADGVVDGAGTVAVSGVNTDLLTPVAKALGYSIEGKHHGGEVFVQARFTVDTSVYNVGCGDCHATNPDPAGSRFVTNGAIIDQFAESGHGDVFGEAWIHYDWRSASRASCQRCHTATGYVTKLGNEADTTNVFGALDVNLPGEVLRCTACHTDISTGAVRDPGSYTETYNDGQTYTFPSVGKSNLCVRCHSGRDAGSTIAADTDADGVRSFINSHYLTAGGTIFTTTGYEYTGKDYTNVAFYQHDKIGIANPAAPAATDAGPCAGCHMGTGTANHSWEVVSKDTAGVITAINSNTCATCHSGQFALTAAILETEVEHYHAALEALKLELDAKGIYFYNAHPYFYTAPYVVGGTNTGFTDWAGVYGFASYKDTMGAAFNYNLLHHDPGGYAHNRFYAKRLIFDAIDFIDNGVLDGNITVTGDAALYLDGDGATAGVQRP